MDFTGAVFLISNPFNKVDIDDGGAVDAGKQGPGKNGFPLLECFSGNQLFPIIKIDRGIIAPMLLMAEI